MVYKNGKIYKLWCGETDLIYIGSTCNPLYKRLYEHKTKPSCSSKELFEISNDVKIELIEEFPCNNKMELRKREGEFIRLNKPLCVNSRIAGRSNPEYLQDNKEQIKLQKQKYYDDNKVKLKSKQNAYNQKNKEATLEYATEYYKKNRESILAKQREKYKNTKKI